jgi:hypothetical protein
MNMNLLTNIAPWGVAVAGAVTAAVAALWAQIKAIVSQMVSHVVVTEQTETTLGMLVISHMNRRFKRSPFGEHFYTESMEFVRPENRNRRVAFLNTGHAVQIYWKGRIPIWVTRHRPRDNGEPTSRKTSGSGSASQVTFSYIRGTFKWESFLQDTLDAEDTFKRQESYGHRYRIVRRTGNARRKAIRAFDDDKNNGKEMSAEAEAGVPNAPNMWHPFSDLIPVKWQPEDLGPRQSLTALSLLSINDDLYDVIEEVRFWRGAEKWYTERGIPWRRGMIFYGSPGTGKTSLARALAEELDMPVIVMDIASMTNRDLQNTWAYARSQQPCLVLYEDIDNVFHGRENVAEVEDGVTFDVLLNCVDGIERTEGTLIIFTVNDLSKVDAALYAAPDEDSDKEEMASRPGRIDRAVEFKPLNEGGRRKMAMRIVNDAVIAEELIIKGVGDTAAQFQERCFQRALAELFKARKAEA